MSTHSTRTNLSAAEVATTVRAAAALIETQRAQIEAQEEELTRLRPARDTAREVMKHQHKGCDAMVTYDKYKAMEKELRNVQEDWAKEREETARRQAQTAQIKAENEQLKAYLAEAVDVVSALTRSLESTRRDSKKRR